MKNRVNLIIGLLLSAFFIYLAFRKVQFAEILISLRQANYWLIIPNMVAVILSMVIRAERWKYLLESTGDFRMGRLFPSVMIGFMANNLLPVRLGEVARAYSLGVKSGESKSSIFATIVLERVFDGLAILAMFWLVILFIPFPPFVKKFGLLTLALNIALIIFLVVLKLRTSVMIGLALKTLFFLPENTLGKIEHIMSNFSHGLALFRDTGTLLKIISWSIVLWLIIALSNYFVFMAFGIYPNIAASFILLIFVAAGVTLPSAPGFVGIFQAATVAAFVLLNDLHMLGQTIPADIGPHEFKTLALSFSIVLWLCQFLPVTLLGLYYLKREHLSLKEM